MTLSTTASVCVCVCVPPATSGVILFHVFDKVDLLGVSWSWRATRKVSVPVKREREEKVVSFPPVCVSSVTADLVDLNRRQHATKPES